MKIKNRILVVTAIVAVVAVIGVGYCGFNLANSNNIANDNNGSKKQAGDTYTALNAWKFGEDVQSGVLYHVVRVIDGDTLVADVSGHALTVRLIGADTPETVDPRKPVQCFGPEASAQAKKMLASTSVYLEKDPAKDDYDKYGRILAYVWLDDGATPLSGTLYNEYMIKTGFAHEYTYFNQPYKYQAQFKADERTAKKAKLGLWRKCVVTASKTD